MLAHQLPTSQIKLREIVHLRKSAREEEWRTLTEWANVKVGSRELEKWSGLICWGVFAEARLDSVRSPANALLANVSRRVPNEEIFLKYYGRLVEIDGWDLERPPDLPSACLQLGPIASAVVLEDLERIALGRAANKAVLNCYCDSPIAIDVVAYLLARSPEEMQKRIGVTWNDNDPIQSMVERDFRRYRGQTTNAGVPTHDDRDLDGQMGIFKGLTGLAAKPMAELLSLAREDGLGAYLGASASNATKDTHRSDQRRDWEICESAIDVGREALGESMDISFFDTISSNYPDLSEMIEEAEIGLESLGFDLSGLSNAERNALEEMLQGFREGYTLSGKRGDSFRQFFGEDDYDKKMTGFKRAKKSIRSM